MNSDIKQKYKPYEPQFGDSIWVEYKGCPKKVYYNWIWGWIADVDETDTPHVVIDAPYVIFDHFTNEVKEYDNSKSWCEIGFSNANSCRAYCRWKNECVRAQYIEYPDNILIPSIIKGESMYTVGWDTEDNDDDWGW